MLAYVHWDLNPVAVRVAGIPVTWYSLLFIGGAVLCVLVLRRVYAREGLPWFRLQQLVMVTVVSLFVGARLGHCLFYEPDYYLRHPLEMLLPVRWEADGSAVFVGYRGMASHGAAFALVVSFVVYAWRTRQGILSLLDLLALVLPLGACFIRLGNLANSEILGLPTTVPWAFVFGRVDCLPRHPAQLYEALAYLAVFVLNMVVYRRLGLARRGLYWGLFLLLVFLARFFVEFAKERQVAFEEDFVLSVGQWLSIPFILAGAVFLWNACRFSVRR